MTAGINRRHTNPSGKPAPNPANNWRWGTACNIILQANSLGTISMGSEGEAEPFLIELLVKRYSWFVRELNTALDEQGLPSLTRAQIIFLFYLEDGKDRSRTMSEKLGLSRQAVSLTARELESAGIIEFLPDPDKKSAKIIKITKSGKHSVGRAFNILRKLESRIARRAGKNELVAAKKLLNQDWG